jgi:hypothetical protein
MRSPPFLEGGLRPYRSPMSIALDQRGSPSSPARVTRAGCRRTISTQGDAGGITGHVGTGPPTHSAGLMPPASPWMRLLKRCCPTQDAWTPVRHDGHCPGAWLSLAHLAALRQNQPTSTTDDLDRSIKATRLAITRVPAVSSARSVALLHRVATEVEPVAHRSPAARTLLRDLRSALP